MRIGSAAAATKSWSDFKPPLSFCNLTFVTWRMVASITPGSALAAAMNSSVLSDVTSGSSVIRAEAGFVLRYPLAVFDSTSVRAYHMPLKTIRLTLMARTIITIRSQDVWISRSNFVNNKGVITASFMSVIGDAPVDQCHLPVSVAADITLVSHHDDGTTFGVQLGEQLQD